MPVSKAGRKIKAKLKEQYGSEKGEGIFYAMENKGEIPGMKKMKGYQVGGQVPNQQQAAQARRAAVGRQNATDTATNQRNLAMAQSRQQAPQARQVGMAQSKQNAATNQRNLAMAQSRQAAPKAQPNPFSRRGMAKGGMVKSTGKMNTGIKKCGE
jgi:hypothetical protein